MSAVSTIIVVFLGIFLVLTNGEGNYEHQALSINYEGDGLPAFGTLDGVVTKLDELSPKIELNRTQAELGCGGGHMNISLTFKRPFFGIIYADFDRNSPCKITGSGNITANIVLPLRGCGTLQSPVRVFTNNIVVRFHPGLEIDGDEVITIICRYPPPIVPTPIIPAGFYVPPPETVKTLQPLREFEILLIICAIVFLALLLLGIGCSYYCLKKRNIKVIRRRPASTLGSEVTKISDPISMFGGLKIPRAHATDSSGSEELTESVQSEFASEIASAMSEEEYHSIYSDQNCELAEGAVVVAQIQEPAAPGFDVKTVVKHHMVKSPVSSAASSESELILKAQEQYLTTILERTETNTLETLEQIRRVDAKKGPPPVHARIRVHNKQQVSDTSELESESEYSQACSEYFEDQGLILESKETRNLLLDQERNEFDVNIKTRYDQSGFSHSEDDESSTFSEAQNLAQYRSGMEFDIGGRAKNNFDVLIRILEPPQYSSDQGGGATDEISSVFSEDERLRLREVILQDLSVQRLIQTATTHEDFIMIKNHAKIQEVVEPRKWDVLIRILHNPSPDSRSSERMSSKSSRSTRTGYYGAAQEVRSLSEMMVDFSASGTEQHTEQQFQQQQDFEAQSLVSMRSGTSRNTLGARSMADRSGTEIVEYHNYSEQEQHSSTSGVHQVQQQQLQQQEEFHYRY